MGRVVAFGEMLMRLKSPGNERLLQTPALEASFGGAEFNVAASLAQFGVAAMFVSVMPESALGEAARAEVRRFGVDASALQAGCGRMGLYFLEAGVQQRPAQITYDRAGSAFCRLEPKSFNWQALLSGASLLHVSGISAALGEGPHEAVCAAVVAARGLGIRVSVDINQRASLWADKLRPIHEYLRPLIEEATVLFAGADDGLACLGRAEPAGANAAPDRFQAFASAVLAEYPKVKAVISALRRATSADEFTLGGACLPREEPLVLGTARSLRGVVDRIGSGDAFVAGFLYGKLQSWSWAPALEFGLAAAALKHTVPGDVNRATVAEVQAVLAGEDASRVKR